MAIKHEDDEFLVINVEHVSVLMVVVNGHRTPKLWAIAHKNIHTERKQRFLVISLKHVPGLTGPANRHRTPKSGI